jgi:hypothetical protein
MRQKREKNESEAQVNVILKRDLAEFLKMDAAACGLSLKRYIAVLLERRREQVGAIEKRTL